MYHPNNIYYPRIYHSDETLYPTETYVFLLIKATVKKKSALQKLKIKNFDRFSVQFHDGYDYKRISVVEKNFIRAMVFIHHSLSSEL